MEPKRSLSGGASLESTARRNPEPLLPPLHSVRYTDKPLPHLPLSGGPFASSLGVEPHDTFNVPRPRPRRQRDYAPFSFNWNLEASNPSVRSHTPSQTSERRVRARRRLSPKTVPRNHNRPSKATQKEGWTSVRWDQRRVPAANDVAKPRDRHTLPKIDVPNSIPDVPPDEILSPQPKQSVQKILRLTGTISPMTMLSSDSPTLHNSSQKIKQLTGLDFGSRSSWTEDQARSVDDEISNVSTAETTSIYSDDSLEGHALSVGHAESTFSSSYLGSVDDFYTQLTAPKYNAPASALFRDSRSYSEPLVRDALRLSGFTATDSLVRPLTPDNKRLTEKRESWYREHDDDKEPLGASSDEHSDVVELEHTAGKLYHPAAFPLVSSGPGKSFNGGHSAPSVPVRSALGESFTSPPPPQRPPCRDPWGPNPPDDMAFAGHSGNVVTSPGSVSDEEIERRHSTTPPPSSPNSFSMGVFRTQDSLSDDRLTTSGRGPPPLSVPLPTATAAPSPPLSPATRKSGHWNYHTGASGIPDLSVEEMEASSKRFSLLAKIFTSGITSGGGSSTNKNDTTPQKCSSEQSGRRASHSTESNAGRVGHDDDETQPTSTWSPDTPEAKVATFAAAASLVRRAADSSSAGAGAGAATASGGDTRSSLTPLDGESARRMWKRTLDHAKSKAGMSNSSSSGSGGSSRSSGSKADKKKSK